MPTWKGIAGHLGTSSVVNSTWMISISLVCSWITSVPAQSLCDGLGSVEDEALQSRLDTNSAYARKCFLNFPNDHLLVFF